MSTTVLLGLTSFEKIGGQWIFGGASDFSNLLAPWASGSRSLMLRAASDEWVSCLEVYSDLQSTQHDLCMMYKIAHTVVGNLWPGPGPGG